jgi:hypothetical protein
MFHIYRHGAAMAKAPPPKQTTFPSPTKPVPAAPRPAPSIPKPTNEPLPAPPIQKASGTQVASQASKTTTTTRSSASVLSDSETDNIKNVLTEKSATEGAKK